MLLFIQTVSFLLPLLGNYINNNKNHEKSSRIIKKISNSRKSNYYNNWNHLLKDSHLTYSSNDGIIEFKVFNDPNNPQRATTTDNKSASTQNETQL